VRQLLPELLEDVDPEQLYPNDARPAPPARPWVLLNMVASVDGATAVEGRSGALGGDADRRTFSALRSVADAILVGAGTVRAEHYGPPRTTEAQQAARVARGQVAFPRLAIVSGRLDLDLTTPLFAATPTRPIVLTGTTAPPERRAEVAEVAEVVVAGDDQVDAPRALRELRERDLPVVLCEGGPGLNAHLLAAGMVDEVCVTIAPMLVGGMSTRMIAARAPDQPEHLRLDRLVEDDGVLLARYVRG
jgi:riboflavin-specific deaminase-like protein